MLQAMVTRSRKRWHDDGLLQLRGVDDERGHPAGPGPAGFRVEHRHVVAAPAQTIWRVLADVDSWSGWSTLYPSASGDIEPGGSLELTIHVPGMFGTPGTAVVQTSVPGEILVFTSTSTQLGRLATGVRYIQIEQQAVDTCVVTDGEVVGGLIGVSAARLFPNRIYTGLRVMNEGLKQQAEALHRAG